MSDALDINEIARAALARAGLERDTHIALRASLFDPPPRVSGSRERLVEAVGCLLERARQAVAACAGAAIELETEPDGDRVAIRILDNGPALSEGELGRSLDDFEGEPLAGETLAQGEPLVGKEARELADADRIFRDHRGALLVRSRPGEGTCVIALLPALLPSPISRDPRR